MKIIIACILSFAVSAITGKFLVPELRKLKAGQSIREDGPTWHAGKAGTPTMGGLMFILGIFVSILICGWKGMMAGDFEHLYIFFFALIFGGIGFLDDFEKVKHKQNLGLTALQKFLLQLVAAVAFLTLMRFEGMLTPNLYIPFVNTYIILNWVVYMIFAAFVIVGTVNAVNITDGIDGLAGSVTVPVGLFFTVLAIWWQGYEQLGIYAAALVGGILGFLIYNFHPAKVFMGDTGSLFLGGTGGGAALLALVYAAGAMAAMYITYTPVGMVRIVGLQARYFLCVWLALLPALAVLLRKTIRPAITEEKAEAAITPLCACYAVFGAVLLFQHYFVGPVYVVYA